MLSKYKEWMEENNSLNKLEKLEQMQTIFPELLTVRGHVFFQGCPVNGYPWKWLQTTEGEIVDPSAKELPHIFLYEIWDENLPEPTGKCLNCGQYTWDGKHFCSDNCELEYGYSLYQ